MTEEEQLLAAIHEAPREDTLRLAFADWLEERAGPGDADRAAFIRFGVSHPDHLYWVTDLHWPRPTPDDAVRVFDPHRHAWHQQTVARLGFRTRARWLHDPGCHWAYRRGFVSVFEGTEQVLLDAGGDVFKLGPVEEVAVRYLGCLDSVQGLRAVLDAPGVRVVRLDLLSWRQRCLESAEELADWFRRFERVELRFVPVPGQCWRFNHRAVAALREWLAQAPALGHVSIL